MGSDRWQRGAWRGGGEMAAPVIAVAGGGGGGNTHQQIHLSLWDLTHYDITKHDMIAIVGKDVSVDGPEGTVNWYGDSTVGSKESQTLQSTGIHKTIEFVSTSSFVFTSPYRYHIMKCLRFLYRHPFGVPVLPTVDTALSGGAFPRWYHHRCSTVLRYAH